MITVEESLMKWGTDAFATKILKSRIGIGTPIMSSSVFLGFDSSHNKTLCFTVWIAFTPECYRSACVNIASSVGQYFLKRPLGVDYIDLLVGMMEERIIKDVQPNIT